MYRTRASAKSSIKVTSEVIAQLQGDTNYLKNNDDSFTADSHEIGNPSENYQNTTDDEQMELSEDDLLYAGVEGTSPESSEGNLSTSTFQDPSSSSSSARAPVKPKISHNYDSKKLFKEGTRTEDSPCNSSSKYGKTISNRLDLARPPLPSCSPTLSETDKKKTPLAAVSKNEAGAGDQVNNYDNNSFLNRYPQYFGLLVALLVISAAVVANVVSKSQISEKPLDALPRFQDRLKELHQAFPSQSNSFWKSIRVGTRKIFEQEEPIDPAIFIFVANSQHSVRTTQCIADKVASAVTKAFSDSSNPVVISGAMQGSSPEEVKLRIDEMISRGLSGGKSYAVLVDGMEALHGQSAMMFHGYCDNENAQFTRAVFIFTLLAVDEIGSSGNAEAIGDKFVERVLHQRWNRHLKKDMFEPLLGRIGNSNVFINAENDTILRASGCQ